MCAIERQCLQSTIAMRQMVRSGINTGVASWQHQWMIDDIVTHHIMQYIRGRCDHFAAKVSQLEDSKDFEMKMLDLQSEITTQYVDY